MKYTKKHLFIKAVIYRVYAGLLESAVALPLGFATNTLVELLLLLLIANIIRLLAYWFFDLVYFGHIQTRWKILHRIIGMFDKYRDNR